VETPPQLALVRVLSNGGPYRREDVLSVAFADPAIGRVLAHRSEGSANADWKSGDVPEAVLATFLREASPFAFDETVVLSFSNPVLARIVRLATTRSAPLYAADPEQIVQIEETPAPSRPPLMLFLRWSTDDARRFIAVVDKLFTVDRLGWYRHSLALRLLLADSLAFDADADTVAEANRRLETVRTTAADALNAPLLSAFMPQFTIDAAWLDAIEPPSLGKALSALRKCIDPHLCERPVAATECDAMLCGAISRHEWNAAPAASLDAFLPLFIPHEATDRNVAHRVQEYRHALLELFGQMAQTSKTVRLKQMTSANHVLDERLWNLAGALQDAYGTRVA
jgi:hypothetical protein